LYSADGQPGWLTANYAMKNAPSQIILSRPESEIDYSYLSDLPKLPDSIGLVNALVSYEGAVESPYAGLHRLHIKHAGYLKVWVDGELREDRWRESWNAGSFELDLDMQPGKKYQLKMEWLPDGTQSYLAVQTQMPVPEDRKSTRLNSSHVKISYAVFCL